MEQPQIMPANKPIAGRPYKRRVRNILIHKPMQREFTFVLIALLMVSNLAIGFVIHHTIHATAFGGGFRFGKVSPYEILSDVSYTLVTRISCVLFATLIILGLFGLLFLHRVAGPVYRFRQIFLRMNRGEIPGTIKLREGDFFEETASEINRLIKRLEFEKARSDRVKEKINQLAANSLPGDVSAKVHELKDLAERPYEEKIEQ
jgi:hypothetical protein